MSSSLQISDSRWVQPCAGPVLPDTTGLMWPHMRAAAVSLLRALVCWQAKRLERRIKRFELDCTHSA